MPTQREVIRFDTEPVKVKLDKGPYAGIECHGQYGIDWRYSVNDGRAVMYVPEEARDALVQSGVAAGEEVAIRRLGRLRWEIETGRTGSPARPDRDARRERNNRSCDPRPFERRFGTEAAALRFRT